MLCTKNEQPTFDQVVSISVPSNYVEVKTYRNNAVT